MPATCPACGKTNDPHARFCAHCGATLFAEPGADPLLGSTLAGRYRLVKPLGEGGMGTVYSAEQTMGTTVRKVAVKVLKGQANEQARGRFLRECETVVQLSHPNTIRFYDFGALPDGRLYIAMEFVEGRTLTQAIAEGPMPFSVVERLVGEMAGSLNEAHRRGIVHRDLKPDNVLLARDGDQEHVRVLDFGIAKQREAETGPEITAAGTIVGTPAYMSPEQLAGREVDPRSDLYALGLMTFEMLTGKRPFSGSTPLEWATLHTTKPPPSFDDYPSTRLLPAEKRAAIYKALAKEPEERQPSVRRFLEELTGKGSPISSGTITKPASLHEVTPRPAGRSGALVIVAALVGAAAVAAGYVYWTGLTGPGAAVEVRPDAGPPDAGVDAGPPEPTVAWLQIVTAFDLADDPALALGATDGRCAVIRPNGKILLEITSGLPSVGDGTSAPELQVVVREGSGPYRIDIATDRHREQYINIASDLVGSAPLDVDQVHEAAAYRYIRIKNRGRTNVCLDALGVFVR
jgi:predicted Ser/Thr protein kinase